MSAPLTAQQQLAVTARGASAVLSSGAGCGKTHVLTARYLSHLRHDGVEVGQVVALTFTERAAREMRGRIRRTLLAEVRGAAGDAAAEAWARHLRGLEAAPISTIHAFCANLLRQHALDAGLDPRFEVLEEVLSANLEQDALSAGLQRLLTSQSEAGDDLRRLVLLYGWAAVVDGVGSLLRAHDGARWRQWLATSTDEIVADWQRRAKAFLGPYLAHQLASRPAVGGCLDLLRRHPPRPGPMVDRVQRLLAGLPDLPGAPDPAAALADLLDAARVGRDGAKAWPDGGVYEAIKKALEGLREELRRLGEGAAGMAEPLPPTPSPARGGGADASPPPLAGEGVGGRGSFSLRDAVDVGKALARVVGEVAHGYAARKRREGVVDFQDLLLLTRDLLRERPDLRARLQERYRFLLIDELQDTDPVQMELVEALCGAGLAGGKLFAVGDANQSIYRFRGAEVALFRRLRGQVPEAGRLGLTVNFRSQPAVLDFTNALLGDRLADYEPLRAFHPQVNAGPCVEFLWAPREAAAPVAAGRAEEAEWIARRIAALVNGPPLVVDRAGDPSRLRPARPGDVALLFRALTNVAIYEAALRRHGVDYYLVGGRAFFAQQEIYDLLHLLRALENPEDAVSLAGALRSPFCCVSDEALFVLGRRRGGLWAGLLDEALAARLPPGQRAAVERARRHLGRWRGLKDRLPIAGLLAAVLADSGFDAAVRLEHLGERKLANLWKLQDLARTFDRSGRFGLAEFIARLGELVRSQPREEQAATQPENADVVRILSIHQAKGLEFPVVFVPDVAAVGGPAFQPIARWNPDLGCVARPPADEEGPPFADGAWRLSRAQSEVEEWGEELRTLYVACTRAQDYLVLSASLTDDFQPANAWMQTLCERFDRVSGVCLVPGLTPERTPRVLVFDHDRPPPELVGVAARAREAVAPPEPVPELTVRRGRSPVTWADLEEWTCRLGPLYAGTARPAGADGGGAAEDAGRLAAVLSAWDFADGDGWRVPLRALVEAGRRSEWQAALERFAASELRRELAGAARCARDAEYLLDLSEGDGPALPPLRGTIDCLWRDAAGGWRLLFFVTDPRSAGGEAELWEEWRTAATLAAEAWRRGSGAWPREVTLYRLGDGLSVSRPGGRLAARGVLAAVAEQLRDWQRQPVAAEAD